MAEGGEAFIRFIGGAGSEAYLSVTEDGPALTLADKSGACRLNLEVDRDGQPSVLFLNQNSEPQLTVTAQKEGAQIAAFDGEGKMRLFQGTEQGHGFLRVMDEAGEEVFSFGDKIKGQEAGSETSSASAEAGSLQSIENQPPLTLVVGGTSVTIT